MANDLDAVFEDFEAAWTRDENPDLSGFLPAIGAPKRHEVLLELIRIDLEFRWRNAQFSPDTAHQKPWTLHDYSTAFPELTANDMVSSGLVAEEYRVRSRWGDRPDPIAFASRFEVDAERILLQLQAIDAELAKDKTYLPPNVGDAETVDSPTGQEQATHTFLKVEQSDSSGSQTGRFGEYDLLFEIARGGMGVVYKAKQRNLNRIVALKMIRSGELASDEEVKRFYA